MRADPAPPAVPEEIVPFLLTLAALLVDDAREAKQAEDREQEAARSTRP